MIYAIINMYTEFNGGLLNIEFRVYVCVLV